ncbi:MAG: IPExxxVDY family protein [Marinilabiliaceae bacterium]|jgi:hypothetical protein|nr:IPExxxVDY family protein [Marinilabiliaceae bacterium]
MMSPGRKSLHRLKIDNSIDHHFFGISCPEPDYKISLQLNNKLNLNLRSSSSVSPADNPNTHFGRFVSDEEYSDTSFQLVKNRVENKSLSKSYESLDYLFLICGNIEDSIINELRKKILDIPMVSGVFSLEKNKMQTIYSLLQIY